MTDARGTEDGGLKEKVCAVYNYICLASTYQVCVVGEKESPNYKEHAKLFEELWIRYFGAPDELHVDPAGAHLSHEFLHALAADGTFVQPSAGQAHWQLGCCERHGQTVERKFEKCLATVVPGDREEWEFTLDSFLAGKNRTIQEHGFSAAQHVDYGDRLDLFEAVQ